MLALSRKERAEASAELCALEKQLEEAGARLTSLTREFAVAEGSIRSFENRIHELTRRRAELTPAIRRLREERDAKNAELSRLTNERREVRERIAEIELKTLAESDVTPALEREAEELLSQLERLEARKKGLSEEIAEKLSNASLEGEDLEAELNELSMAFVACIGERDHTRQALSEKEAAVAKLRERVALLEKNVLSLEETKRLREKKGTFRADVERLEEQRDYDSSRMVELEQEVSQHEALFADLCLRDAQRKDRVRLLEEGAADLEGIIARGRDARRRVDELSSLREEGLAQRSNEPALVELRKLLVESVRLEERVDLQRKMVAAALRTIEGMAA